MRKDAALPWLQSARKGSPDAGAIFAPPASGGYPVASRVSEDTTAAWSPAPAVMWGKHRSQNLQPEYANGAPLPFPKKQQSAPIAPSGAKTLRKTAERHCVWCGKCNRDPYYCLCFRKNMGRLFGFGGLRSSYAVEGPWGVARDTGRAALGAMGGKVSYQFSLQRFLTSGLGWFVLGSAGAALWMACVALRAQSRFERKTRMRRQL